MKNTLLLFAAIVISNIAFAGSPLFSAEMLQSTNIQKSQVFATNTVATNFKLALPEGDQCGKYKKMKRTGLILLCVGAPVAVMGIACLAAGVGLASDGETSSLGLLGVGSLFTVGGLALTGAGIPLLIIGNVKSKKYCGGTSFQIQESKTGLGLAYKF